MDFIIDFAARLCYNMGDTRGMAARFSNSSGGRKAKARGQNVRCSLPSDDVRGLSTACVGKEKRADIREKKAE